jgi:hypothetical protein
MYATHRTTPRFNLNIPVKIRRFDQMDSIEHTVVSSNVSAGGVYFLSDIHLEIDTPVRVCFKMPEQIFGKPIARWCCEGRVIHIHPSARSGNELGVGLSFQMYALLTAARLEVSGEQFRLRAWWPRPR